MRISIAILAFSFALIACKSSKKMNATNLPEAKTESLQVGRGQILQVKNAAVLVVSKTQTPSTVDRYYVLQGVKTKEIVIPSCLLSGSKDFVSLQSGSDFWILTISESNRYKDFLTSNANAVILNGFGLTQYRVKGVDFDTFIQELKDGKHDSKF